MRRTFGLTLAAGLLSLLPAAAARAQVSYGFDSLTYGYQPSATYYQYSGYQSIYTDASNGVYNPYLAPAPPRPVAPYSQPPYDQFGRSTNVWLNTSPTARSSAAAAAVVQVQPRRLVPMRRGLFGRPRPRR
jgi:hypothetical protein